LGSDLSESVQSTRKETDETPWETTVRNLLRRLDANTLNTLNPTRRQYRQERRRIATELAEFRSPAERAELDLILARHSDEDVRAIADLLPPRLVERY
jgi:hypothetical protein